MHHKENSLRFGNGDKQRLPKISSIAQSPVLVITTEFFLYNIHFAKVSKKMWRISRWDWNPKHFATADTIKILYSLEPNCSDLSAIIALLQNSPVDEYACNSWFLSLEDKSGFGQWFEGCFKLL